MNNQIVFGLFVLLFYYFCGNKVIETDEIEENENTVFLSKHHYFFDS